VSRLTYVTIRIVVAGFPNPFWYFGSKDFTNFWKNWNRRWQASVNSNSHISGFSNDKDTADGFAKYFSSVYFDSAAVHLAKVDFENLYSSFYTAKTNDTVSHIRPPH